MFLGTAFHVFPQPFKYSLKNPRDRTTNNDQSTQTNNDVQDTTVVDDVGEVEQ